MRVDAMLLALLSTLAAADVGAAPETVGIFSAGSLRGVVNDLASIAAPALNVEVQATFGGSGLLRERIEKGERPDLCMSADLASPRKLAAQGRTVVPAVMIARNRMCVLARRAAGLTAANLIDRLLATGMRVKTSTPLADPAGDYAWTDLASLPVPAELDPHPVDGLAILSARPAAMRLALYLLSEKGQAMVARAGLVPVAAPDSAAAP